MTSFYKNQRMAYTELDKIIEKAMKNKTPFNINMIVLSLTNRYEVSDKAIVKRINLWVNGYSDVMSIKDDEVIFK